VRAWLRRSILPLVLLIVLAPAAFVVLTGLELADRANRVGSVPVATPGAPYEGDGYTVQLTDSAEFVGTGDDGNGIPSGLTLIATLTEITADGEVSCTPTLVRGTGETERAWPELISPSEFRYGVGETTETLCSVDPGGTITLETVFLTPEGTYDSGVELELELLTDDGRSRVRLPVAP
jgi:hypothetical protein